MPVSVKKSTEIFSFEPSSEYYFMRRFLTYKRSDIQWPFVETLRENICVNTKNELFILGY